MKNWNSAWLIFFLTLSLVGCGTMKGTVSSPDPDKSNSWQQASNPMITMSLVQKVTPNKKGVVEKKQVQALKTPTAKKEASAVGLGQHLPSRQWFVNDMKQEDIG